MNNFFDACLVINNSNWSFQETLKLKNDPNFKIYCTSKNMQEFFSGSFNSSVYRTSHIKCYKKGYNVV
jgi:hypothetical protein